MMDDTTRPNPHLPPHVRRIQQLAAAGAARRDGLIDAVDAVEQLTRIVDAWDDDASPQPHPTSRQRAPTAIKAHGILPMTRAEVAETSGLDRDPTFDARFALLVSFGAIQQCRRKSGTDRYVSAPLLLVGATMLADLADRSAVDRLVELIVVALDRVDDSDTSDAESLAIARTLTRMVNIVAADINHQVEYGTVADAIEARLSRLVQRQVARLEDLTARVHLPVRPVLGSPQAITDAVIDGHPTTRRDKMATISCRNGSWRWSLKRSCARSGRRATHPTREDRGPSGDLQFDWPRLQCHSLQAEL